MIIVRFDVILGKQATQTRSDVLHMLLGVAVSIGLAVPLANVYSLEYVPPIAVATAGVVYLAAHFAGRLVQKEDTLANLKRYGATHTLHSRALGTASFKQAFAIMCCRWRR